MSNRCISTPVLVAIAAIFTAATASAQTPIWSDEFTGTELDPTKWTFDVGGTGFGNQELQFYSTRNENIWVENGSLVIQAKRESYEGKEFTSARIKSHGRMAVKYGTIEARIKVPDLADGLWPAFWLLGDNIGQVAWPACGEIDILEMGTSQAIAAGIVNRRVSAAGHWDYFGSYAGYGNHYDSPVDLNDDYHVYRLTWTPTALRAYIDNNDSHWGLNIDDPDSSMEEFHNPAFLVLNLAVGGINFVDITDPNLITAPFPAKMYVDWIRIYDNGATELTTGEDTAEVGQFGIFTDDTPVNDSLAFGTDAEIYIWNNMTPNTTTPYEGGSVMGYDIAAGGWFGMGVYCLQNRNMQNYANGELHMHMKTTSNHTFGVGVASASAGEGWLDFVAGGEEFGLVRDGQWHEVVVPLSRFANVDFNTIIQIFMLKGEAPAASFDIAIDNVYWTPSQPLETPENGNFGVFTENAANKTAGEFILGWDGEFYVWEDTLTATTTTAYEGSAALGFTTTPGNVWFGAAFTPNHMYNLTAFRYPESKLHFAMKTSSDTKFKIGIKGGTIEHIGQEWVTFENGNDPYGFVRDGQWHVVEIPMTDLSGIDLTRVTQLFELLGTDGPIADIAVDDICFLNGGTAIHDNGGGVPTANAGDDQTITLPTNSITLVGSGSDDDGTIVGYEWTLANGPSTPTMTGANTNTVNISNMIAGVYIFRLTVTDNDGLFGSDTVTVTVATPEPTANAGDDQTIELPTDSVILTGSGWDSDGTIEGYAWQQISGPSTATMTNTNRAIATAGDLIEGTYVFQLTVTDNDSLTGTDQVSVFVIDPPDNIALGKPATASSAENAGMAATNAVDGDTATTRWASIFEDPQWIEIDLQGSYNINQVIFYWETASAAEYDIEVSDDGEEWTSIYYTNAGPGGVETVDVSGTGSYIRMYGHTRNTPWGYSLYEFEVYGTPADAPIPGDLDHDGDVDLDDYAEFVDCFSGPQSAAATGCEEADLDSDNDIDLRDFAAWDLLRSGS